MTKGMLMVIGGIAGISITLVWGIISLILVGKKELKFDFEGNPIEIKTESLEYGSNDLGEIKERKDNIKVVNTDQLESVTEVIDSETEVVEVYEGTTLLDGEGVTEDI